METVNQSQVPPNQLIASANTDSGDDGEKLERVLVLLNNKFSSYKKTCQKMIQSSVDEANFSMAAKFAEHINCWDIALGDIQLALTSMNAVKPRAVQESLPG